MEGDPRKGSDERRRPESPEPGPLRPTLRRSCSSPGCPFARSGTGRTAYTRARSRVRVAWLSKGVL
jgi:hypothetical protein